MNTLLLQATGGDGFDAGVVWQTLSSLGESLLARVPYIVIAVIVFGVFLVVGRVVRSVVHTAGQRTRLDVTLAELLGRLASFVVAVLGLFVSAVIIFPTFKPGDLVTGLGITSVAIGFAFKDVLQNFFAGILILWRRPFIVGDQIRFREYEGTVEEINVRSTRLKTYDGERAVLPNGDVYTNAILVCTAYLRYARLNNALRRRGTSLADLAETERAAAVAPKPYRTSYRKPPFMFLRVIRGSFIDRAAYEFQHPVRSRAEFRGTPISDLRLDCDATAEFFTGVCGFKQPCFVQLSGQVLKRNIRKDGRWASRATYIAISWPISRQATALSVCR